MKGDGGKVVETDYRLCYATDVHIVFNFYKTMAAHCTLFNRRLLIICGFQRAKGNGVRCVLFCSQLCVLCNVSEVRR